MLHCYANRSIALGDRSNLTFPDGTPIYVNGSATRNETFQLLLQSTPPKNASWLGNWLPGPEEGGDLTVSLRFYGPEAGVEEINPNVTAITAL